MSEGGPQRTPCQQEYRKRNPKSNAVQKAATDQGFVGLAYLQWRAQNRSIAPGGPVARSWFANKSRWGGSPDGVLGVGVLSALGEEPSPTSAWSWIPLPYSPEWSQPGSIVSFMFFCTPSDDIFRNQGHSESRNEVDQIP